MASLATFYYCVHPNNPFITGPMTQAKNCFSNIAFNYENIISECSVCKCFKKCLFSMEKLCFEFFFGCFETSSNILKTLDIKRPTKMFHE